MATGDIALGQEQGAISTKERVINDFSINVATVNGSGSQSANSVLLKSIFGMGVPVSGKNLFPSNIAGLPTWYTIRASKDGYVARKRDAEVLVALNPETAREDTLALPSGGIAIYEENLNLRQYRDDVVFYPVPLDKITLSICPEAKLRKLVKNMVYVGVVAHLLSIDLEVVENGLRKQFAKKQKVFELNFGAVKAGRDYAAQNLTKQDPYFIERMDRTAGKIIIDGNAAAAWAPSLPESPWWRGIRSLPPPRWWKPPPTCSRNSAYRPKARPPLPWSRLKTSWRPSAWCWARAGPERAHDRPPPGRASR